MIYINVILFWVCGYIIGYIINRPQIREIKKKVKELEDYERYFAFAILTKNQTVRDFAEEVKVEFYQEFDEIIPSIMADKIDELVKKYTEGNDG